MSEEKKHVVIVGGGITGVTAAYYLQKKINEEKLPITYTLVEANEQLGGKIRTEYRDGFVIERGPDSFLARKTSASKLVREVGLEDQLTYNTTGQAYILINKELYPIPEGSIMGIPTKLSPFITTRLFSPIAKARAGADLVLPRSQQQGDQALGQFFRRRLGNQVVDHLIEPLLSGIYAGDIDKLSLMSTFPQFYEVEKKYRSLIVGMSKFAPRKKPANAAKKSGGIFLTLKTGLESLVEAVEDKLDSKAVKKGTAVRNISKAENRYELILESGEALSADSVVMAAPHEVTASLFSQLGIGEKLQQIPSTSVATVALAFPKSAVSNDVHGTGFVVSKKSDYTITACTWTNKKWPHSTPEGKVLLRCYVGRAADQSIVYQSDEEILATVLRDLNKVMNISAEPDFYYITRWKKAMPQYTVGHQERIESVQKQFQAEAPGVFLTGASYEGVGLPDCIVSGEKAVEQILDYLRN
jgi:oxygen-dependent protoporphyrinogen oxidase